jgi:DNA repair protein RecO (recombination protein O)
MAYWKSLALCLRVIDYGETSQIATFFTRDLGRVAVMARGAKRRGSRFSGAIEPLTLSEIVCVRRRDAAALHTLAELDIRSAYRGARQDLDRLHQATYVIELLREATADEDPHPDLFDLACATLERIAAAGAPGQLPLLQFEARALEVLGLFPELARCVDCGAAPADGETRLFGPARGGILCRACAARERAPAIEASAGALHALAVLGREPEKAQRLRLTPAQERELRAVVNAYLAAALERKLRLAKYL